MKNLKIVFTLILLNVFTTSAQEFQLNSNKSSLEWTGKAAFSSYALTGSLKATDALLKIENDSITELSINVDMKSLEHENKDLKNHLRSADFFEVKKYKLATFHLTNSCKIVNGQALIKGKMTIKGISQIEMIETTITMNKDAISILFETSLDRTKYGVKHNSPSFFKSLKENAIANEFMLKGTLEFSPSN